MPKPKILLAFDKHVRQIYVNDEQLSRLEAFADWDWFECEGGGIERASEDPEAASRLTDQIGDYDGMIVCHGAPQLSPAILDHAKNLKIIGELEGDRFAARIDLNACWERDIRTVDTTNASWSPASRRRSSTPGTSASSTNSRSRMLMEEER